MRVAFILCLLGIVATLGFGALAAGVDVGAVAIVANGALIYGLVTVLR
jgi:hypothetical protein